MSARPVLAIAGGSGYLGARLSLAAAEQGWQVRVLSRRSAAWPGQRDPRIELTAARWQEPDTLTSALHGAQALILLAAANEHDSARDPVQAVLETSAQAMAWLSAAKAAKVARLLYFSTVHVYGPPGSAVLHESSPLRPRHPYAETHLAAELFVQAAHRRGELDCSVLRLSNAVGAPVHAQVARWTLLANDLARQAAEHGSMRLHSDGLQARDFVPISDVCSAVNCLLARPQPGTEADVLNLGSGQSMTAWELAQRLQQRAELLWGRPPELTRRMPDQAAPPAQFQLDVSALRALGWQPRHALDAELDATLLFCKQHFAAAGAN